MLSTGTFNKQKLLRTFGLGSVWSGDLLPDRCTLIQLSRMGAVIFLTGLIIFSLPILSTEPLDWSLRLLGATGLVALLLPASILCGAAPAMGGRLSLNSAPGAGTLVRVEVAVSQEVSDASHPYSGCR